MKMILQIGLIALLAYLLQLVFPWWMIMLVPFAITSFTKQSAGSSFLVGFIGIFILWFVHAWVITMQSGTIMTEKVAELFSLPGSFILLIITAIIGAMAGGMGGLSGYHIRSLLAK